MASVGELAKSSAATEEFIVRMGDDRQNVHVPRFPLFGPDLRAEAMASQCASHWVRERTCAVERSLYSHFKPHL